MNSAAAAEFAWPLLVAELCALCQKGTIPSKISPDSLARVVEAAEVSASGVAHGQVESLRCALMQLAPPNYIIRFELHLAAPLWRLGANYPDAAMESGGAMPCCLKVFLPIAYPLTPLQGPGGKIEVFAPGALGKLAAKIVTDAARSRMAEMQASVPSGGVVEYLTSLVDWIETTELHEFAAAACQPDSRNRAELGQVRAFVRFHHVLSILKQRYLQMWAEDLDIAALLAAGQPAMLLIEGPRCAVRAYLDRATKIMHWGPTPARLVGSANIAFGSGIALPKGLAVVADKYPNVITGGGTYNGRDSVNFPMLADCLEKGGHVAAARELANLLGTAFAHVKGRVKEASNGSGWVGYACREPELAPALPCEHEVHQDARPPEVVCMAGGGVSDQPSRPSQLVTVDDDEDDPDLAEAIRMSLCTQP